MSEHDLGLALDSDSPDNKSHTVSNRLLHYLLAGIPVVASSTKGQAEIASAAPEAVRLFPCGDVDSLAGVLNHFLSSPSAILDAKAAAVQVAEEKFCWERQAQALIDLVGSIF